MLFYSFGIQNVTAKIVYHTFAYMFFGTAFTIVMVPYNAILSDMTDDYNEDLFHHHKDVLQRRHQPALPR